MNDASYTVLWRISNYLDLSGIGGFKRSGRWHNRGTPVVYLADHPLSALTEALVHLEIDPEDIPDSYTRLKVMIPKDLAIENLEPPASSDWQFDETITRRLGDAWLREARTCIARVPSVIATEAWNYLLNPSHPDAHKVEIVAVTQERYDPRLFRIGTTKSK